MIIRGLTAITQVGRELSPLPSICAPQTWLSLSLFAVSSLHIKPKYLIVRVLSHHPSNLQSCAQRLCWATVVDIRERDKKRNLATESCRSRKPEMAVQSQPTTMVAEGQVTRPPMPSSGQERLFAHRKYYFQAHPITVVERRGPYSADAEAPRIYDWPWGNGQHGQE